MIVFLIEKSVEGIASALYKSFTENVLPDAVFDVDNYQTKMEETEIDVTCEKEKYNKVISAILRYAGEQTLLNLNYCVKSCKEEALSVAFNYSYLILKERKDLSDKWNKKEVSDFNFIVQTVSKERHYITGFLRFKETLKGVLYAEFSPDNDIVKIVATHFFKRLKGKPFAIHDLKRKIAVLSNGKEMQIVETNSVTVNLSNKESEIEKLWKKYVKSVNIKERKNLRQQSNFMPKRYRKFMPETWE